MRLQSIIYIALIGFAYRFEPRSGGRMYPRLKGLLPSRFWRGRMRFFWIRARIVIRIRGLERSTGMV